jgi:osmotically-inducible protein OsmY
VEGKIVNSHQCAAILIFVMTLGAMGEVKTSPTTHRTRPAGAHQQAALSDAELEKAIRARFAASKISSHHFQVHVQGGVATLEGKTDVLQHKGTATRLAKNVGAIRVINHIEVSEAAREKAAGNLAQGRRRAQIKRGDSPAARSDKRTLQ